MIKFLLTCAFLCASPLFSKAGRLPITDDFDKGLAVAAIYKMPVVLSFIESDRCIWSRQFVEEFLNEPVFYEKVGKEFVFVNIDYAPIEFLNNGRHLGLKEQFQVESFPTFILLSQDGEEITRFGFPTKGKEEFVAKLGGSYGEYLKLSHEIASKEYEVKDLYLRAKHLGFCKLAADLLVKGLQFKENGFFLIEKYVELARDYGRDHEEALEIRKKILDLEGKELLEGKMRLAICDFQELHERLPQVAFSGIQKLLSEEKLPEEDRTRLLKILEQVELR